MGIRRGYTRQRQKVPDDGYSAGILIPKKLVEYCNERLADPGS